MLSTFSCAFWPSVCLLLKNVYSYPLPIFYLECWAFLLFFFLAVLGLRCCARAFSSCGEHGPLLIAVRRILSLVASLVAEHRLQACGLGSCGLQASERRLSSCGSRAYLLHGMWDPPGPEIKPVSPALAGGFLTTAPPGKPHFCY